MDRPLLTGGKAKQQQPGRDVQANASAPRGCCRGRATPARILHTNRDATRAWPTAGAFGSGRLALKREQPLMSRCY